MRFPLGVTTTWGRVPTIHTATPQAIAGSNAALSPFRRERSRIAGIGCLFLLLCGAAEGGLMATLVLLATLHSLLR